MSRFANYSIQKIPNQETTPMFWTISAILILIAIAFLLPPMLRKQQSDSETRRQQNILIANEQLAELEKHFEQGEISQQDYQNSRDELELTLFSNMNEDDSPVESESGATKAPLFSIIAVVLLVPLLSILLYMKLGNLPFTTSLDPKKVAAELNKRPEVPKKADGSPDIDAMVAGLQKKMEENPDNAKGWFMLGRSYMVLKRYPESARAFEKSLKLKPDSAQIMLSLADALAMENQGQIAGRPVELINQALKLEPDNLTALWLGGMAASQQGKYAVAVERWQKLIPLLKDQTESSEVRSLIAEAMKKLRPEDKARLASINAHLEKSTNQNTSDKNTAAVTLSISLADEMRSKVKPTDIVFIYAKAMSGPPMPLAALKKQVKDLPLKVTLDDSMAMIPAMKISSHKILKVGARISKSGQPVAQAGDIYTEKQSVKLGETVELLIDSIK